jgi:SpoVK/Ycf46/Vps4 family AAA+-type ATPase
MAPTPGDNLEKNFVIDGVPEGLEPSIVSLFRTRILFAVNKLVEAAQLDSIKVTVGTPPRSTLEETNNLSEKTSDDDPSLYTRALTYKSHNPYFNFDLLVLPDEVKDDIYTAVSLIEMETKIFDEWNLRSIEPFPRTSLNFHGQTGTGKTLAAHAVASKLGKLILTSSYAQIESKYHGEGPKNVEALFWAAERDGAILFIDEADSLLSQRISNVTQGSEQAINSMRSQLLICLEKFSGIVIFATNFVQSYDKAFRSRIRDVYFPLPDYTCRIEIWRRHFPAQLPLSQDIVPEELAKEDSLSGRDIKNIVLDAALHAATENNIVSLHHINAAILRLKASRLSESTTEESLNPQEMEEISEKVKKNLR